MKPYARQCGGDAPKLKTNENHYGRHLNGSVHHLKGEFKDKTQFCESRPGAKEKIRNAKRSYKKRARQQLKREMHNDAENSD